MKYLALPWFGHCFEWCSINVPITCYLQSIVDVPFESKDKSLSIGTLRAKTYIQF